MWAGWNWLFCRGILGNLHVHFMLCDPDVHICTHIYTPMLENVSVLLVSVPSSVPVCLLGLVWVFSTELCQAAICGFMLYEQWLCLWAGRRRMALLLWLFFFLSIEFVSLLLPPCTWAGMVGEGVQGFVACACNYRSFFCESLWLWLPVSAGTGWVEELTCLFPVWRLLKEYTKFFGGIYLKYSRHHSHPRDPGRPKSGCICVFRKHQLIRSGCCGNNIFYVSKLNPNNKL